MRIYLRIPMIMLLFLPSIVRAGNEPSKPLTQNNALFDASDSTQSIYIPPASDVPCSVESHPSSTPGTTLNLQLNNTNNIYTAQNAQQAAHAEAQAAASAWSSVQSRITNFLEQHNIQLTKLSPSELAHNSHEFWKRHKKRIIVCSCVGSYLMICAALMRGNHYVNRSDLWASWKKHMSTQELQNVAQHELQQLLREAILHRYLTHGKNRLNAYLAFIQAVDYEHRHITRYLTLASIIKKCRLMRFFPMNDTKIKRAQRRKKRLAFVKHIFISWAAQQHFETV